MTITGPGRDRAGDPQGGQRSGTGGGQGGARPPRSGAPDPWDAIAARIDPATTTALRNSGATVEVVTRIVQTGVPDAIVANLVTQHGAQGLRIVDGLAADAAGRCATRSGPCGPRRRTCRTHRPPPASRRAASSTSSSGSR